MKPLVTAFVVFVVAVFYLLGIVLAVRNNLAAEVFVAFLFPAICMAAKLDTKYSHPRIRELFFIESLYNLMVVLSKLAIQVHFSALHIVAQWGFLVFMLIQLGGFLRQVTLKRSVHGMIQTILGIITLLIWWWGIEDRTALVDDSGRFYMWGEETALSFRMIYSFWSLNLILADSMYLPKLIQVMVQLASLSLAWWSREWFHVRMLTASHLFFLDGLFGHYGIDVGGKDFCIIPEKYQEVYDRRVKGTIRYTCTAAIVCIFVWNVARVLGHPLPLGLLR